MDINLIKSLLSTCHEAKKIMEMLPRLPHGLSPRHIYIIEAIYQLSEDQTAVRVSDVSQRLKVTRPGVTRLINELDGLGVLQKKPGGGDKREVWLSLTRRGLKYHEVYVLNYHSRLASELADLTPDEVRITQKTVKRLYQAVCRSRREN